MKMIDFTHKKRPDLIQLVLIIAVVCLALGAITPSASAVEYDWEFGVNQTSEEVSGSIWMAQDYEAYGITNWLDGSTLYCSIYNNWNGYTFDGYYGTLIDIIENPGIFNDLPYQTSSPRFAYIFEYNVPEHLTLSEIDVYVRLMADFIEYDTDFPMTNFNVRYFLDSNPEKTRIQLWTYTSYSNVRGFTYSFYPYLPPVPFYVDVVDSGDDYQISVSGFDGTQLSGSAYTIAVSTFTGGYQLPLTSFPMYLGDSPVHFWTSDQTFTLPVYLSDGVTPIDYYCVMSFPADPTYTGYQFWWNMTTSGYLDYPFNTTYPPVVLPTPIIPPDIIPDPESLNNTVNITGWYQDMGYEGNNITAPIYSGLRGWFNENLIPVIDFFLVPTNYVASTISDSAETSASGITYIAEELGSYAAPFNIVGGYVVLLVPEVVWIVVFAALSIGYVVLLIKISTGSIRDTIGRFLGGGK